MKYNELKTHGSPDFPIEIYHIDHTHPKYEMNCHYHGDLEIIRVISGKLHVSLDNEKHLANEGDIIFVGSEVLHSAVPENCVYECVVFNLPFFLSSKEKSCVSLCERLCTHDISISFSVARNNEKAHDALNSIFDLMAKKGVGYRLFVISKIYEFFALVIKNKLYTEKIAPLNSADEKSAATLKKVLSYIRENYDKPLSLEQISAVAKMSDKYFCSFFKKMTNKTPIDYLICYRIECSARLLCMSDLSVTDIAYSCGFNDLSYFIKTFKLIKGVTPKEFRKGSII